MFKLLFKLLLLPLKLARAVVRLGLLPFRLSWRLLRRLFR
jgi:hypothetical protein